jgi:hypothetical protein
VAEREGFEPSCLAVEIAMISYFKRAAMKPFRQPRGPLGARRCTGERPAFQGATEGARQAKTAAVSRDAHSKPWCPGFRLPNWARNFGLDLSNGTVGPARGRSLEILRGGNRQKQFSVALNPDPRWVRCVSADQLRRIDR